MAHRHELNSVVGRTYLYQTINIYNDTADSAIQARASVQRNEAILPDPENWEVAVERWYIRNLELPVWRPNFVTGLTTRHTISFVNIGSGAVTTQAVIADSAEPYKTFQRVVATLNTALTALVATTSAPSTPTFSYTDGLFSLNTDSTFRSAWYICVNQSLYHLLNNFDYLTLLPDETAENYAEFNLTDDTITQLSSTTQEWSPVNKIVIESTLPMLDELLPQGSTSSANTSTKTSNVLTDYKVYTTGNSNVFTFQYDATGNHRWHSLLQQSNFRSFTLDFKWVDYQNNSNVIDLYYKNQAEVKLVFREKG